MSPRSSFTIATLCLGLAGCVSTPFGEVEQGEQRRDLSPAAVAALPDGVSSDFLLKNGDGCYLVVLEAADPPRGVLLRDDLGVPVCDA